MPQEFESRTRDTVLGECITPPVKTHPETALGVNGNSPQIQETESPEISKFHAFLERIDRPDLKEVLTPSTPWVSASMEIGYDNFPFTGGLGILEGDKLLQAKKLGIPYVALTLAYPEKWTQSIENFRQKENKVRLTPEDLGLERIGQTTIMRDGQQVTVDICRRQEGSCQIIALYNKNLKELYYGSNNSEDRLHQQVVLGFGGQRALDLLGLSSSLFQLNESAKVFSAVAYLDKLCQSMRLDKAIEATRGKVLFTNHTLQQAAVQHFSRDLFEKDVMPNIQSEEVKNWLRAMIDSQGGYLNLSLLAFELSGRQNGVSKVHAQIASEQFKRLDGSQVNFEPITNAIFRERWQHLGFFDLDREAGIVDESDLVAGDYLARINGLDYAKQREIKKAAKGEVLQYLKTRADQHNRPVEILGDAKAAKYAVWARRYTGYKQPGMPFEDPQKLAQILEGENMHLIIAGKAHPSDKRMGEEEMSRILTLIENNPVLKNRVHFIEDYDIELAQHLVAGADIWINTPEEGQEACGTSSWKAILNRTRVLSTIDGGLADINPPSYIPIEGVDYPTKVRSLYSGLELAAREVDDLDLWSESVKEQLKVYLSIIAGGRMMADYINFGLPPQEEVERTLVVSVGAA